MARDGYTLLDFFSDIGGIQGILVSAAAIFLGMWNYNNFDNFLVSKLYKMETEDGSGKHQTFMP